MARISRILNRYRDLPHWRCIREDIYSYPVHPRIRGTKDDLVIMGNNSVHYNLLYGLSIRGNICLHSDQEILGSNSPRDVYSLLCHLVSTHASLSSTHQVLQLSRYLHCAMSISTDLAIIIIPLPTIFHMNLERRKKWSLAFTFALGGL